MGNESEHVWCDKVELGFCTVCGLYEGGLTTDCSGEKSSHLSEKTYGGLLDYRKDEGWIRKPNPTNQSFLIGKIFDMINGRYGTVRNRKEFMLRYGLDKEQYIELEKRAYKYIFEG